LCLTKMNYVLQYQHRTIDCRACFKPIKVGEPSVRKSVRTYTGKYAMRIYHVVCFFQEIMGWFKNNEFVPRRRGIRPSIISEGLKPLRANLMSRRSQWLKRKRLLISDGKFDEAAKIDQKLRAIYDAIELVGGAPRTWVR